MKEPSRFTESWIATYLRYVDNTEPPVIFHKWCAVSVIASALQRKCFLDWGYANIYPNMYIVLTAPAGRARKGTAMNSARAFLNKLEVPLSAEAVTRESLIKSLSESERVIPSDDGSPAIVHSSLTVFSAELTVFLGYNNIQLMSDLTDWFDCADSWTYRTKTQGTDVIQGVFINLLGATTPDLIRSALPIDAVGGGLTSRLIFVYAEGKGKQVPIPFNTPEVGKLREMLLCDIEEIAKLKGQFKVNKSFLTLWKDWYLENGEKSPFGLNHTRQLDSYVERRPTQLLKLSMIMSANRSNSMIIDREDLEMAISLLTETEKDMPWALGGVGADPNSDMTFRITKLVHQKPYLLQDIIRLFIYDGSAEVITATVNGLAQAGLVKMTHTMNGPIISGV